MQLIISQVRKWVLDRELGAKTIWERSIPEILPPLNDKQVRLHKFTPADIILWICAPVKNYAEKRARRYTGHYE